MVPGPSAVSPDSRTSRTRAVYVWFGRRGSHSPLPSFSRTYSRPPDVRVDSPIVGVKRTAPSFGRSSFRPKDVLSPLGQRALKRATTLVIRGLPATSIQKQLRSEGP